MSFTPRRVPSATQSATSRRIKALDDDLGAALFRRKCRALAATDDGRRPYETCAAAFSQLRGTGARIRAPGARAKPAVQAIERWLMEQVRQPPLPARWSRRQYRRGRRGQGTIPQISYKAPAADAVGLIGGKPHHRRNHLAWLNQHHAVRPHDSVGDHARLGGTARNEHIGAYPRAGQIAT